MTFDLSAYFARIGVSASGPSSDALRAIQIGQMRAIPFENIAPFLGEIPDLSPEAVWHKLIASKRGGYCFELNGLLGCALRALRFPSRPILARVHMGAPAGGARTHLAWIVEADGTEWLVDAGFGGPGPLEPLRLTSQAEQTVAGARFRLRAEPHNRERVLERWKGEAWFSLYSFDEARVTTDDIEAANFYCARSDKSPFPDHLMMNSHGPEGSTGLFDRDLRIVQNGREALETIGSKDDLRRHLAQRFRIDCGGPIVEAVWERLSRQSLQKVA